MLLRKGEKKNYTDIVGKSKHNLKKVWSILKGIINRNKRNALQENFKLNNGSVISDKLLKSEKFNDFFIGIGPSLANKIPKQNISPKQYMGTRILNSIYLSPVLESELQNIIMNLRNAAPGYDGIAFQTLKCSLEYIKPHFNPYLQPLLTARSIHFRVENSECITVV